MINEETFFTRVNEEIGRQYKTLKAFAKSAGISQTTLHTILHKSRLNASFDTIVHICDTLGIEIDPFRTGSVQKTWVESPTVFDRGTEAQALENVADSLDNRYKKKYRHTSVTVSMVNYHFVFCPRYRRKIFLIDGLENRFKELVLQICEQNKIKIHDMECHADYCHLFVSAPPSMSPADVMKLIKRNTGYVLKREFFPTKQMQVWTRNYFVSTASVVSSATIQKYVEEQKTRGD